MYKYPTQLTGQLIWETRCFIPRNLPEKEIPFAKVEGDCIIFGHHCSLHSL